MDFDSVKIKIGKLSEDLKEKLKEGKKIEMLLRQEKFDPLSNEEIIERFEDFAE